MALYCCQEEGLDLGLRFGNNITQTEIISPVCNKTVRDFNNRIDTRIVNRNRSRRKIPFCTTSRVFFPGAKNNNNNGLCKPFIPQRCRAGTVCENTDNYPEDIVRASLKRLSTRIRGMYLKVNIWSYKQTKFLFVFITKFNAYFSI